MICSQLNHVVLVFKCLKKSDKGVSFVYGCGKQYAKHNTIKKKKKIVKLVFKTLH